MHDVTYEYYKQLRKLIMFQVSWKLYAAAIKLSTKNYKILKENVVTIFICCYGYFTLILIYDYYKSNLNKIVLLTLLFYIFVEVLRS